ncbi:hypothetical protein MBLNU459_g1615t1 [Dothideomycetes sp. NU459]
MENSYFHYQPSAHEVSPIKSKQPNVHCLDAFHTRPGTPFEYPANANMYAKRALPALPPLSAVPSLSHSSSGDSLYSPSSSRPSTAMDRISCDKSLPPLPLERCPSLESIDSSAANGRPSRPRAGRSISFRGLLNRHTYPSNTSAACTDDVTSLESSVGCVQSTRASRADSVMGDMGLTQVKATATTTRDRRPSTLSLSQIRAAAKKANANPPALPTRPTNPRKNSLGAHTSHRWNIFGRSTEEDKEDIPPMPMTPPYIQELSFSQCYYFYARNCNGYVLSNGANGDACENCANAGYLGSP